jgi:hypothetical protein
MPFFGRMPYRPYAKKVRCYITGHNEKDAPKGVPLQQNVLDRALNGWGVGTSG